MKNRLLHIPSSLIGLAILGLIGVMFYQGKINASDLSQLLTTLAVSGGAIYALLFKPKKEVKNAD